jgi:hypothetical protein
MTLHSLGLTRAKRAPRWAAAAPWEKIVTDVTGRNGKGGNSGGGDTQIGVCQCLSLPV